ncbi:MAG: hypothetical protein NT076_05895 [Candidatus Pacearchaeota archaeon]|nr:hypothetical protein [Candidatus Pacearchaeota archaeon]
MSSYKLFGEKVSKEEFYKFIKTLEMVSGSYLEGELIKHDKEKGKVISGTETYETGVDKEGKKYKIKQICWENEEENNCEITAETDKILEKM